MADKPERDEGRPDADMDAARRFIGRILLAALRGGAGEIRLTSGEKGMTRACIGPEAAPIDPRRCPDPDLPMEAPFAAVVARVRLMANLDDPPGGEAQDGRIDLRINSNPYKANVHIVAATEGESILMNLREG